MGAANQNLSLGQFVKQLAALLQEKKIKLPFKDQRPWHLLFYELSKQPQKGRPNFFDDLVFDWDAPYPKCQELSEFLHALHFTANVSARNPSYDSITIDHDVAKRWAAGIGKDDPLLQGFVSTAVKCAEKEFTSQIE